ncbi:Uu.00g037660.m01.CDS01 [Anthostomella pinea]|uniref:Uu.00g037660.m01.CDS01 n=1 Tax=Anthostomella pinea TaxID=933095 RepID=A0AAI8YDT4_9PEZI|nr:Uu.00g037660.m01.CDS01 [Anthostomella pinea]
MVYRPAIIDRGGRYSRHCPRTGYNMSICYMVWGGSNNIERGVTVDLGFSNSTTYDAETQVASIRPGSRWRGVYETLDPLGVTVLGGRAASVGVAGFLTGGGNSFYSAKKGFACDNVVNFEVRLMIIPYQGGREIINANSDENPDLYQALKDGQSNFGIVTRFDMQGFTAPLLWGGVVQYNKTTGPQHIDAYVDWTNKVQDDVNGSAIVFWTFQPALQEIIIVGAYEDTGGNVAAPAFDEFLAIQGNLSSTMRIASHLELTNDLEQPKGYRDIWWTGTIKNDKRVYEKIVALHEELCDFMSAQSPDGDSVTQAMFQLIPTIFTKHSEERGGNELGLDRETENVVMVLITLAVNGEEQQAVAQEQVRKLGDETMAFAASLGSKVEWEYINYAYSWQDPLASYGVQNVAKIREMAAKFDPQGIFQTRAPGGFKISKSTGTAA